MKILWILVTILAGTFLPLQAGLNARFGRALDNPVFASLISFVIGALVVALFILVSKQPILLVGLKRAPYYVWLGGVAGALYVTITILAFPRIGPALTFGLVVLGQMVMAIILDHFNILVNLQHQVNLWRIAGVVMIIGGVILIRNF
jgi:transporter family-2 protein